MQVPDISRPLRAWLWSCPLLDRENRLRVDYLGDEAEEYSLIHIPTQPKYKTNICGKKRLESIQEDEYIFAARESYGQDIPQNLENIEFFNAVSNWIREKDSQMDFPEIEGGLIKHVTPTLSAYVAQPGVGTARYQIQLSVTYQLK